MSLGIVFNLFMAMAFGASMLTDAYNIGTYLPMMLMCFFGLDLMRAVFVAVFSKLDIDKKEDPSVVFSSIITIMLIISVGVTAIGILFAAPLVHLIAPDVNQKTAELAVKLTKVTMPGIMLMMLGALSSAVLLAYHKYAKSQWFDLCSRFIMTCAAIICIFIPNIYILAFGFVGGQLIAAISTLVQLHNLGLKYQPRLRLSPVIVSIIRQSIPVWVGVAAAYVATTVQRRYASTFESGAIASLTYATMMFSAAMMLVSVPMFRALSPRVARYVAMNRVEEEAALFWKCIKQGTIISLLLTAILWFNANEVTAVALKRGAFDAQASIVTSGLLAWIGIGIWGNIISYQASAVLFAHNKSYFIMLLDIVSSIATWAVILATINTYGIKGIGMSHGISHMIRGIISLAMAAYLLEWRLCGYLKWLPKFTIIGILSIVALKLYLMLWPGNTQNFLTGGLHLCGAFAITTGTFYVLGLVLKFEEATSMFVLVAQAIKKFRNRNSTGE